MELTTSKSRGHHGMRVAPRCRGAASSMLRVSNAVPSTFGSLGRASAVAQRLTQSLGLLPVDASATCDQRVEASHPLFTRLWPSAGFGREALWQDTLVALD